MFEDLKQKELEIYLFLKRYTENKGYPPTVREICDGLNIKSTSTVHTNLERLAFKGYIKKDPSKPRTLEIINTDDNFINENRTVNLPVIDDILLDSVFSIDNVKSNCLIDENAVSGNYPFIYRIKNTALKKYGLEKNDFLILDKKSEADNGEKVLALIDGNLDLFVLEKSDIENYKILNENTLINFKRVKILGIIKGLYRKY